MPDAITITDPADDRIADYRALTDVELRTRWEPPHGLFIAEGELVLRRAVRAGYRVRSVLVDVKRTDQLAGLPRDGAPLYAATQAVLEAVTGFHVHRGVLASLHRRPLPAAADVLATSRRVAILEDVNNHTSVENFKPPPGETPRRIVILENLNSHTNLGAVFRNAAALDMDAVLLSPSCADPLYRRSVRVSMGQVFAVPYARFESWPAGLDQVRAAGFTVVALTPDPNALPIQMLPAEARRQPALLLGSEGAGLTAHAMAASDYRVRIPMANGVDSLNVTAAAAVAFWELSRA